MTARAVFVFQFLIRCASSSTTTIRTRLADRLEITKHELVVEDQESALPVAIRVEACAPRAVHDARLLPASLLDLATPLVLQGCGTDHQRPLCSDFAAQHERGGDRLDRLSEAHVVGQERPAPTRQEQRALFLVRMEPEPQGTHDLAPCVGGGVDRPQVPGAGLVLDGRRDAPLDGAVQIPGPPAPAGDATRGRDRVPGPVGRRVAVGTRPQPPVAIEESQDRAWRILEREIDSQLLHGIGNLLGPGPRSPPDGQDVAYLPRLFFLPAKPGADALDVNADLQLVRAVVLTRARRV